MNAKQKKLVYNSVTFGLVILAYVLCSVFYKDMSRSLRGQLIPICCWIVMAVSLNLVVGISGELSLGHAGFMSIGAFTGIDVGSLLITHHGVAIISRIEMQILVAHQPQCQHRAIGLSHTHTAFIGRNSPCCA